MIDEKAKIYRFNDEISFRQCSLANNNNSKNYGDCTNFSEREENWKTYYMCNQYGIHLHCTKHPEQELILSNSYSCKLKCLKCDKEIEIDNFNRLLQDCIKLLNIPKFKNAQLIRLDDWYIPEIKEKVDLGSKYWMHIDVKTDKDKDTIVVIYVGKKDSKEKVQFFIKPEKMQLTSDHKDLDPATILSKIDVTLKDRKLSQEYDRDNK